MNRVFHSVVLAAALFLSTTGTSSETQQPSAATMTTQMFEFVSNGNRLSGLVDVPAGGTDGTVFVSNGSAELPEGHGQVVRLTAN